MSPGLGFAFCGTNFSIVQMLNNYFIEFCNRSADEPMFLHSVNQHQCSPAYCNTNKKAEASACFTYLNLQKPQRQDMGDRCLDRRKTNGGSDMQRWKSDNVTQDTGGRKGEEVVWHMAHLIRHHIPAASSCTVFSLQLQFNPNQGSWPTVVIIQRSLHLMRLSDGLPIKRTATEDGTFVGTAVVTCNYEAQSFDCITRGSLRAATAVSQTQARWRSTATL